MIKKGLIIDNSASRSNALMGLFLLGLASAVCLAAHLPGSGGSFLSDDFAHVHWLAQAQSEGGLVAWVIKRFYRPLESGNFAYRPVVFASYALDWIIYGTNARGWHLTNLIIHLANGAVLFLLIGKMAGRIGLQEIRFVALTGAALFLAIPFAGESTFWPVGRFDLLACFFSLVFLLLLIGDSRRPARMFLRWSGILLSLLLALLSKESAIPILAVGGLLLFAFSLVEHHQKGMSAGPLLTAALKDSLRSYWPVFLLALAYFLWRYSIFGSPWKVYPKSEFPESLAVLGHRIGALRFVYPGTWDTPAVAWFVFIAAAMLAWLVSVTATVRQAGFAINTIISTLLVCFLLYLLAPASSLILMGANGEGLRNLYIPWALFALLFAFSVVRSRHSLVISSVALMICLWGQWRTVEVWQDASRHMSGITSAVPGLAEQIHADRFALLLLPDRVGRVPFVRNAVGGVLMPPTQADSFLPVMRAMTPYQFADWDEQLARENTAGILNGRPTERLADALFGVFCWQPRHERFHLLETRPRLGNPGVWKAQTMAEATEAGCLLW